MTNAAFVPAPALPRSLRPASPNVPARPLMTAAGPPVTRRAFAVGALAAAIGLALPGGVPLPAQAANAIAPPESPTEIAADPTAVAVDRVNAIIARDPTIAATILRLAFHDSFTYDLVSKQGGANGSIRLETSRPENFGLGRAVKALEPVQAETGLSWGDAVAVAGAAAVHATGGPSIPIRLGRSTATSPDPTGILPKRADTIEDLRERFGPRGFSDRDIVALSGAHTLGRSSGEGPFVKDSNIFKNDYFQNLMWYDLMRGQGLSTETGPPDRPNFQLHSDLTLIDDPDTLAIVREFANDQASFFDAFRDAYIKMVSVGTPFMNRA